jgi:hypothetical protein
MAEAVEVVGQIFEDRGQTHKFYAPDSSSDEELEVCCRDFYIIFFMLSDVFMYTFEKNRWPARCCGTVTIFYGSSSDFC